MTPFRDLPIGRKLVVMAVATGGLGVVISGAVFLVSTFVALRTNARSDLQSQASIVANNVSAAVAFQDREVAGETLTALSATPRLDLACVFDETGRLFSAYVRTGVSASCPTTVAAVDASGRLSMVAPVTQKGRRIGTLFMQTNNDQVRDGLLAQTLAALIGMSLGVIAASLLSDRIQRVVSRPILELSAAAARISKHGDYSVRAARLSNDEVGTLVDTFNGMVEAVARRDEQLRAADRSKDEFLASLSHELRTPLNAVLGWIQVLQTMPADAALTKRAHESIERNAKTQAILIEDLLDISRIVSGKLHFRPELVDLVGVVDAALDVVRPSADGKHVTIERQLPPAPQWVNGDPSRLQQIVWNLLSNAVKFTAPDGHVRVSIAVERDSYALSVADDGAGMTPQFVPHAFDRFRQGDGSSTRVHRGLGLGLAIARELAELHGGRVAASSPGPGLGSTFTVWLPLPPGPVVHRSLNANATPRRLDGRRVLVVDDDQDARELARTVLENFGAVTSLAASANEALGMLARGPFDVLLCDLAMPEVDGLALLEAVRSGQDAASRLPAIAVSAHADPSARDRAMTAGFLAVIPKPFDLEVLINAVARASGGPNPA